MYWINGRFRELMSVAEFECKHQDADSGEPQVSPDIELSDSNGIPLPLEATVCIEYENGIPVSYCVADCDPLSETTFHLTEGAFRPLS